MSVFAGCGRTLHECNNYAVMHTETYTGTREYAYVYIYIYVCLYVYVYMYMCIYIYRLMRTECQDSPSSRLSAPLRVPEQSREATYFGQNFKPVPKAFLVALPASLTWRRDAGRRSARRISEDPCCAHSCGLTNAAQGRYMA